MSAKPSSDQMSRRDFFKTAGVAGVGGVLAASGLADAKGLPTTAPASQPGTKPAKKPTQVPMRQFGKNGPKVAALALGGMFDIGNNQLLLKQAIKMGVTYWDTANGYGGGNSELGIGKFFGKYPAERKKIFLVTKSGSRSPRGLTRHLNLSLERMKTNYVDLFFLHSLRNADSCTPEIKTWAEKAKKAGKIRLFGFSTHSNMAGCLTGASKLGWIDGIMMTYNYRMRLKDGMRSAIDAAHKAGIGLTAMKVLGRRAVRAVTEAEIKLIGQFTGRGFNEKQAMLKAIWGDKQIASICTKMDNMRLLTENTAAVCDKTKLSAADEKIIEQYARRTAGQYCAGCGDICQSAAGGEVPICDVMRFLMYHNSYKDQSRAKELFAKLPARVRRNLTSTDYSLAEQRCPQHMPIADYMAQAAEILA